MPRSARRSPKPRLAAGETVDMSMARPPSPRPSAAPPSPNSTSSTWGASGTMVITVPAAAAASAGEPATVTLSNSPASASAFPAVRFQATTSMPVAGQAGGHRRAHDAQAQKRCLAQCSPRPPPPGVSILKRSPVSSVPEAFAGNSSPFTLLRPRSPGPPPSAPGGAWRRRSVISE